MKSIFYFILMAMTFLCCDGNKYASEGEPASKIVFNLDELKSDPISIESTSKMISQLLEHKPLENLARRKSFGGYFPAELFDLERGKIGVMFYHCFNPNHSNNLYPEFFLAMEQVDKFDMIPGDNLYVPYVFPYNQSPTDVGNVERFIRQHTTNRPVELRKIDRETVEAFMTNFKALTEVISPDGVLYAKYQVSFFKGDEAYQKFMSRRPTFVRYYMGLVLDADHEPNYLRPILGGTKADGTTITTTSKAKVDQPFLQKSWPPPPNSK